MRPARLVASLVAFMVVWAGCGSGEEDPMGDAGEFTVTSPAFDEGDDIPVTHALDGDNVSPPLAWSGVPDDAAELALTVTDPDASNFVHWIVWGIDPSAGEVTAGAVPAGATVGTNQMGRPEWVGPAPPAGQAHTYVFRLHALSRPLTIDAATPTAAAVAAIDELTTATAELRAQFEAP